MQNGNANRNPSEGRASLIAWYENNENQTVATGKMTMESVSSMPMAVEFEDTDGPVE